MDNSTKLNKTREVDALNELERLRELAHVPGMFKCPRCALTITCTAFSAVSGSMHADVSPQECANGCGPMWRVTERDLRKSIYASYEKLWDEVQELRNGDKTKPG